MNKKVTHTWTGVITGGLTFAVIDFIDQYLHYKQTNKPIDWSLVLKSFAQGGLIGGAIGLAIGALRDHINSLEEPINTCSALEEIVQLRRLTKTHPEYIRGNVKTEAVRNILTAEFGRLLMCLPENYGSTEKGTALVGSSDFDISLRFKPTAYSTTETMLLNVHDVLQENKKRLGNAQVRLQGKSVGVRVKDNNGLTKIDVVPCRISKKRGNKTSGYLHKREDTLWGTKSSYTKTNIPLIKSQKISKTQQKLIVLIKCWKDKLGLKFKGTLIEALVKEAYQFNWGRIPGSMTMKLVMVWKHIADNLLIAKIRSVENSNNVLTQISRGNKKAIVDACLRAIEEFHYQPNSIIKAIRL